MAWNELTRGHFYSLISGPKIRGMYGSGWNMRDMAKPRFVFLLLKEHPYGREMLHQILSVGFTPEMIIEEDFPVADEEREKFLKRIEGNEIAPTIDQLSSENGIPLVTVPIHNSSEVMPHIEGMDLDLIVFGGTRIIRGEILDFPKDGVVNSHPGLLPECRDPHLRHGLFITIFE